VVLEDVVHVVLIPPRVNQDLSLQQRRRRLGGVALAAKGAAQHKLHVHRAAGQLACDDDGLHLAGF
jgi:hypothetical protein